MCVQSVPFDNLARNNDGSWVCPHCQGSYFINRSLYYRKHWAGRCQVPSEQGATEHPQEQDGDWTGLAAEIAEEQRAAAAELQQAIMQNLSTEQQEQLRALLADYAERVTARVQELQEQLQPAEVEDGMADDAVGSSSKQRIDKLQDEVQEWLYDKARLSSLEANLQLFAWRSEHAVKDRAMDDLLSLLHGQVLPEGNRLAGSLHLLRGMLGVDRPRVFEYHACCCEKHYWPPCPKEQWATTEHGQCPHCQGQRFKTVAQQHGGTQLVPAGKRFWVLDPCEAVKELFLLPDFATARGTARTKDKVGSWWASAHYKDLDMATGGHLDKPENSAYELGFDGAELTIASGKNTYLAFMRCRDLPEHMLGKQRYCKMVLAVPGPKPACMDAYLDALGEKLAKLSAGVDVVPGVLDSGSGRYGQGCAFIHRGFISALHADAPARAMLLCCVASFTAILACIWCALTGTRKGKTTRYLGYCQPVTASGGCRQGEQFQMGVSDNQRRHNSATMQHLMDQAQDVSAAGGSLQDVTGFHSKSPLFKHLPYMDVRTISIVPFLHAFCQGVLKDLLKALFATTKQQAQAAPAGLAGSQVSAPAGPSSLQGKRRRTQGQQAQQQGQQQPQQQRPEVLPASKRIPAVQRREIAARVAEVVLHPQTNRPLRNPVKYHAGMHMDELADGVRGLFALLFWRTTTAGSGQPQDVLQDPEVKKAWGHLRRFACFHLAEHTFASQQQLEAAVDEAQQELLDYCKLAEQDFDSTKPAAQCSSSLCTYNLHHLLCVLGVQAKYRGLTVYWLEAWLERAIGWLKRRSRDRVVHDAAHLAVSVELDNRGMQRAAAVLGKFKQEERMDGVPRLLLGYSKLSELLHAPAAAAHCAMYGDGQEMAADLWARIKDELQQCLINNERWSEEWAAAWDQQVQLASVYKQATLAGGLLLSGTSYQRLQTRNGSRVLVFFRSGSGAAMRDTPYAAQVDYFVLLRQPANVAPAAAAAGQHSNSSAAGVCMEKLAVLQVYNTRELVDPDLADLMLAAKEGDFESRAVEGTLRAVPLDVIQNGLHSCKLSDGKLLFVEVAGRSRKGAFAVGGV